MKADKITLEVVSGVEGPSISLSSDGGRTGYRIAGPKPWGGGSVTYTFKVDPSELREWLDENYPKG